MLMPNGSEPLRENKPGWNEVSASVGFPWFALHVRSRYEKTVASFLDGKGYEWFLPTYRSQRRWSDRIKETDLPLFPGYLFCRLNPLDRLPILKTPGLLSIVGTARIPTPVEAAEIVALRTVVSSGLSRQPWPYLEAGQRVRIEQGALAGLEGIFLHEKGCDRLVLSVTLLQRSIAAEIDRSWVVPLDPQAVLRPGSAPLRPAAHPRGDQQDTEKSSNSLP
jgi:transcription antitermination factor NusG